MPTMNGTTLALFIAFLATIECVHGFSIPNSHIASRVSSSYSSEGICDFSRKQVSLQLQNSRRNFLETSIATPIVATILNPSICNAEAMASSSSDAKVTSKIFIQLKGLPTDESNDINQFSEDIITIGLFENDAPEATSILKKLVSNEGLSTKCKPKEVRTLQREQLEANKVYNACMETQDTKGVNYDLSTVWRVVKDERIDLGAVSGKFVARENPFFDGGNPNLKHDMEGIVSVRRGNEGGFGFTIYPSSGKNQELDEDNIVVGRVIDGMDVVRRLNNIPVVQSAQGINYKGLTGASASKRSAPSRACRYGSTELYCNEFKPLKKILIQKTGQI